MLDVVSVVADGDDARRAPQGVILAVLNQFLKAFGTNYFLRVSPPNDTVLTYFLTSHLAFAFYLIYFLKFFMARFYLRRSFVAEVRRATL